MAVFFIVIGGCYAVINTWILWWLWRALEGAGGGNAARTVICLALAALATCFPLLYRNSGDSPLEIALLRAGTLWMGMFLYVFVLVLLMDGSGLITRLLGKVPEATPRYAACLFVFGLPLCLSLAGWINAAMLAIREYDLTVNVSGPIPTPWDSRPLTIAAISDMHLGRTITAARINKAADLAAARWPDVVFFLGDVLDDHIMLDVAAMREAVSRLSPPLGVWGIPGNHEYISDDIRKSLDILEQSGISMLRDAWTVLGDSLLIVGRDDFDNTRFGGSSRKGLSAILEDVPGQQRALPLIVLDHQPHHLEEVADAGAALQLSGHTHNGQLWPFNLVVKRIFENAHGHSMRGNTHFIVSAGTGT